MTNWNWDLKNWGISCDLLTKSWLQKFFHKIYQCDCCEKLLQKSKEIIIEVMCQFQPTQNLLNKNEGSHNLVSITHKVADDYLNNKLQWLAASSTPHQLHLILTVGTDIYSSAQNLGQSATSVSVTPPEAIGWFSYDISQHSRIIAN